MTQGWRPRSRDAYEHRFGWRNVYARPAGATTEIRHCCCAQGFIVSERGASEHQNSQTGKTFTSDKRKLLLRNIFSESVLRIAIFRVGFAVTGAASDKCCWFVKTYGLIREREREIQEIDRVDRNAVANSIYKGSCSCAVRVRKKANQKIWTAFSVQVK